MLLLPKTVKKELIYLHAIRKKLTTAKHGHQGILIRLVDTDFLAFVIATFYDLSID